MKIFDSVLTYPDHTVCAVEECEVKGLGYSNLKGGRLVIDNVKEVVKGCQLREVQIESRVPLMVAYTIIEGPKHRVEHRYFDRESTPYSIIWECLLVDCSLPTAYYDTNLINRVPTGAGQTHWWRSSA